MSRSASKSKLGSAASRSNARGKAADLEEEQKEEEPEVPQLAWQVLSEKSTKELAALPVQEAARKLAAVLSLGCHEESLWEAAQLDYFVAGYWCAKEHKFTDEQTSAFFSVLHNLLENLKEKQLSLSENMHELQKHMAGVGVSQATSLRCFSPEQAVQTVRYVTSSLFQHYRLFEFLFTEEQQQEQMVAKLPVCLPPDPATLSPPPLEEALSLDLYQRCLAPQPPEQEQEDVQREGDLSDLEKCDEVDDMQLLNVSTEEVKSMMETVAKDTLTSYQVQVSQKLKEREASLLNRISKLEKQTA